MEVKIQCACGTKFKFDVEPVNNRMPMPVNCPSCGNDATAQANEILRSSAPAATLPTALPHTASSPRPPSPPVGLRINVPAAAGPASAGGYPPPPIAPLPGTSPALSQPKQKNRLMTILTVVLAVLLVGLGAWRFGAKWYKRVKAVVEIATAVGSSATEKGSEESSGPKNLWYEDCVVLFIRHSNHLDVAETCKSYWKDTLRKKLNIINEAAPFEAQGEYELIPAHNGYVRIIGGLDWPKPEFEGLAKSLSQKFGTLVFEMRSEHFADTYHFGVYDQGVRKFHAQMDINMKNGEPDEVVTTESSEFAITNGYSPGPEGFKEFHLGDADKITQKLGMKLWDEQEDTEIKGMLMREEGAQAKAN